MEIRAEEEVGTIQVKVKNIVKILLLLFEGQRTECVQIIMKSLELNQSKFVMNRASVQRCNEGTLSVKKGRYKKKSAKILGGKKKVGSKKVGKKWLKSETN